MRKYDSETPNGIFYKEDESGAIYQRELRGFCRQKRTALLLRSIGFKMPIKLNKSGYIGSISYKGRNVNIFGEKFSKIFSEEKNKYSIEKSPFKDAFEDAVNS